MYTSQRTTWFLIADGARMRMFESLGSNEPEKWTLIDSEEAENVRKASRELGTERAGRGQKTGSGARFAMDAATLDEDLEDQFIHGIAANLNAAVKDEKFDQLVLTLSPRALGELRKKLTPETTQKLIGVFDKEVTQLSENDLFDYFKEHLKKW